MKIENAALIGLGAMGVFFAPRLEAGLGREHFCVLAEGERRERLENRGVTVNGTNYRFRVESGDIEIHHNSFDGRCGMWTLPPESGDAPVKVLHAGDEAEITFDSRIHDLAPDYIEISNSRYRKPAVFSFRRVKASA